MRIYAYGCRPPVEGAAIVQHQLRMAHAYQCALVAIERQRRAAVDHLYRHACPAEHVEYEAADAAVVEAISAVRITRSTGGDMLEPDDDMKQEKREIFDAAVAALTTAKERQRAAWLARKAARKAATPKLKHRLQMCDRGARARNKRAYNLAGTVDLAWGTRLRVAESAERAAKMSAKLGALPHFPRFDGGGTISVQLQNGLDPARAMSGADTRMRIELVDAMLWQATQGRDSQMGRGGLLVKNGPRKGQPRQPLPQPQAGSKRSAREPLALVRLRVGSLGRTPVWAAWPVVLHRPLPTGAPIKWAQVHVQKVGARTEWRLLVTVDDEVPKVRAEGPTLAINLGWRNLADGGVRVAYAVGTDDHEEEVRVPPAYHADGRGVPHVEAVRGIRDRRLEQLKKDLLDWLDEGERPEWISSALRYVDQWRSAKQVARLLRAWREHRFGGDAQIYEAVRAWEKQDRHLRFWECDKREKLLRMRKDFYRTIASRWAGRYARIIVTDMDLRDFAELPAPEEGADSKDAPQRRTRTLAAPSELRGAVKNACSTRSAGFEEVKFGVGKGAYMTQTCHSCGIVFAFAARQDLEHTCECGVRWDQDSNHCKNLLASAGVAGPAGGSLAPVGDEEEKRDIAVAGGRWKKRRSQTTAEMPESIAKSA